MSSLSSIGPRGTYSWSSHLLILVHDDLGHDHDNGRHDEDDHDDEDGDNDDEDYHDEVDDKFLLNFIRTIIF